MEGGAVKELRGSNYNKPVPDLSEDGAEAAARNHVLRLFRDPVSGEYGHPVVFIEHGGHEFWPSPFWSYTGAQKHGGDDIEPFLTSSAPNLGEVEHPLGETPAALPILQFNGFWGTYSRGLSDLGHPNNPPPGPPLHFQWSWPSSSSIRWQLVGLTP